RELKSHVFEKRKTVCENLDSQLKPKISIVAKQAVKISPYVDAIIESLRGSAIRSSDAAEKIASSVSPFELVEICENSDAELLANLSGLSPDRCSRIIAALNNNGLGEIALAHIDDDIEFSLLDGTADYRDIEKLSIGQRCTVILPIILAHKERTIIIDQPEDHLNNAFIVD